MSIFSVSPIKHLWDVPSNPHKTLNSMEDLLLMSQVAILQHLKPQLKAILAAKKGTNNIILIGSVGANG